MLNVGAVQGPWMARTARRQGLTSKCTGSRALQWPPTSSTPRRVPQQLIAARVHGGSCEVEGEPVLVEATSGRRPPAKRSGRPASARRGAPCSAEVLRADSHRARRVRRSAPRTAAAAQAGGGPLPARSAVASEDSEGSTRRSRPQAITVQGLGFGTLRLTSAASLRPLSL